MKRFLLVLILLATLVPPAISDWSEPGAPEFVFARLECGNRLLDAAQIWGPFYPPPWKHDYPESDEFIIGLLHELTGIRVKPNSYKIVKLSSDEIFQYPFLYLSEPGFLALNDREIANLGEYIRRGGFIMADDFRTAAFLHGPEELEVLKHYLKLAVPERELVKLDISHPVFHSFFDVDTLRMKAPYGDWTPEFWGMSDEHGRLQVIANYNNDIGDFWKYLDEGKKPLDESTRSIRIGIDYIVYAMSH